MTTSDPFELVDSLGILSKALKNVAYQDPELIQYKAEVMLRIFEEQVAGLVGGHSKAMIVATSGTPPQKISVQDMIERIRREHNISDEEALHIKEVSEEKIADANIQQTVSAHRTDKQFLDGVFRDQVDKDIQDPYALRLLYEQLGDPKYTDPGAIFDIMAYTVIQKGLELAESA